LSFPLLSEEMSSRQRVSLIVAGVAALAAGAVLAITLATRDTPQAFQPLKGSPGVPKVLPTPASSRIRAAFRNWPHGSVDTMEKLGLQYPRDPVVQLYLGIALVWAGYDADAEPVLERVKSKGVGWDTPWEIQADNLLHPQYFPNYPDFTPLAGDPLLHRGAILQAQGHQHSAEHLYLEAAKRDPRNAEAQVAAAVGRFDKGNLSASFSRLGPLTLRFPRSQSVRFYLGLLLAWTGQRDPAVVQFKKAVALGKGTPLGISAAAFLAKIETLAPARQAK
jgi:tetratricopeptide (TPR) repeat protein